ncbi:hypothetical protein JCM21900_002379 [Sporobolomyces salmonicolor]
MSEVGGIARAFYTSRNGKLSPLDVRAVGAICASLEGGNYKNALLSCQALLKRKPNEPSALALKALSISLGPKPLSSASQQELLKAVDVIKAGGNGAALNDADLLMVVSSALRRVDRGEEALAILAEATQKHPDNEDVAQEAFLHYVRVVEQRSAQQISMRMSKTFQDERYLWWSIMSIVLQIRDLSNPQAELLLSLAERQLTTHFAKSSTSDSNDSLTFSEYASPHEFHVVTRLLELRAQYTAAMPSTSSSSSSPSSLVLPSLPPSDSPRTPQQALLAHLSSTEGDKWCERNLGFELWRREAELRYGTVDGGEWKHLWQRLEMTLEKGDTNWHTMLYLVRSAVSIAAGSSASYFDSPLPTGKPSAAGLELLNQTRGSFQKLSSQSPKANVERGFLLGLLEIARECRSREWEEVDPFFPLVEAYFTQFSTKMCCFDDLHPYLEILSAEESLKLQEMLKGIAETKDQLSLSQAQRVINALKIARFLAVDPTEETERAAAEDYLFRYFETLPLGRDFPVTELQPADDFALLAGQAFVSAYHLSHDRSYLERALVVLDHALVRSKYKYQIRILHINLLRLLGASSVALTHYRTFGVKNIQYDTLSHLVLNRGATFAIDAGKEAGVHDEVLVTSRWYKAGQKEAAEMCVKAFTYNNSSKIEDFTEFRQRLDNSLQKSLVTVETLRTRLVRGLLDTAAINEAIADLESVTAAPAAFLSDNRDFKTLPNFQPKNVSTIWQQTELGGRVNADWLRAFATIYYRFLAPSADLPQPTEPRVSLTRSEAALLAFSAAAQRALVAALGQSAEAEQAALSFFKEQADLFASAAEDAKTLPWELVQIAEVTLEGFSLLELGIEQRLDEMAANKLPDQPKHSKRLRNFRNAARDLVRAVGQKMTAHGKKVAKERPKFVAAVSNLTQFPALNEDILTNFAHALVESRRAATEGLGAAIHRRCVK